MSPTDYWVECLSESLELQGVKATSEQVRAIAVDALSAHENYGMAFYQPPASDQYNHEMRTIKAHHAVELKQAEARENAYKLEACRIARVDPKDVYIDRDGFVMRYTR